MDKTYYLSVSQQMESTLKHVIEAGEILYKKLGSRTDKKIAKFIVQTCKFVAMHANSLTDLRMLGINRFKSQRIPGNPQRAISEIIYISEQIYNVPKSKFVVDTAQVQGYIINFDR